MPLTDGAATALLPLLLDCVGPGAAADTAQRLRALSPDEWTTLLELAREHKVEPLLARRLLAAPCRPALPDTACAALRAAQRTTALRNMQRYRDFAAVVAALQAAQVPVIALKGMHLLAHVYRELAARSMLDIDLLVPAADLARAGAALQQLGYAPLRPFRLSAGDAPFSLHHLPPFVKAGSPAIEIHWALFPPRFDLAVQTAGLWQRAQRTRIAGVDVQVLAPEDLLLHLAAHATYSHRCEETVRGCCDIAALARSHVIDWAAVVERAAEWRVERGAYLMLRLCRDLFDAAVPDDTLSALEPRDFDDGLLRAATRPRTDYVTPAMARLFDGGVAAGIRTLCQRVFMPRAQVADYYNVPRSSPLVLGLYLLRVQMMAKRWRVLARLWRGDRRLHQRATDLAALQTFLGREL